MDTRVKRQILTNRPQPAGGADFATTQQAWTDQTPTTRQSKPASMQERQETPAAASLVRGATHDEGDAGAVDEDGLPAAGRSR